MTNFKVINETGASPFSFDFGWMEITLAAIVYLITLLVILYISYINLKINKTRTSLKERIYKTFNF